MDTCTSTDLPFYCPQKKSLRFFFLFCNILLTISFICISYALAQDEKIDSLHNVLNSTEDDTTRVKVLNSLAGLLEFTYPDSALNFVNQALELSKNINYKKGVAECNYTLAFTYGRLGEYDRSQSHAMESLQFYEEIGDKKGISLIYNILGNIHTHLGNYDDALKNHLSSLRIKEELKDTLNSAISITNIGLIHYYQGSYNKALEHYEKAIDYINKVSDFDSRRFKAITFNNMGNSYQNLEMDDKALEYYFKSVALKKELGNTRSLPMNYTNIGFLYSGQNKFDLALKYLNLSLEIGKQTGQDSRMPTSLLNIGEVHFKKGDFSTALEYANRSLDMAQEAEQKNKIQAALKLIVECQEALADYQSALNNLKSYNVVSDSLYNEEKARQLAEMEAKYENDKKIVEIDLLNKETSLQAAELERQSLIRNLIIIGAILVLIIIGGLFNRYRFRQRIIKVQREKQNQMEVQKLKEIDAAKSQFFANISHEFRTPLTLILGPLQSLIASSKGNTQNRQEYQLIERNAQRLLNLINQVLDLSKIQAGNMTLNAQNVEFISFIKPILASFSSLAQSRNIEFDASLPEDPLKIRLDKDKIEKVINNLLSNAFKFTPESGFVHVSISNHNGADKSERAMKSAHIEFAVKDSGKGIPEDQLEKIFDRFHQIDNSTNKAHSGTGIGLALAKELVSLHNGRILVESKVGEGSTFKVQLPVSVEQNIDPIAKDELNEIQGLSNSSIVEPINPQVDIPIEVGDNESLILIVEDNDDLRNYITRHISSAEPTKYLKIIEAVNGQQGLDHAVNYIPDAIITDLMMPEMDGLEMSKAIRANEKTSHIPIIMLTAKADDQSKIEGLESGTNDYIAKPFVAEELILKVSNLIDQHTKLKVRYSKYIDMGSQQMEIKSVDEVFIEKVMKVIHERITEPDLDVNHFSHELGMSRSQFYRKLKGLMGLSPNELIRDLRLKRAAQLLEENFGSVAEVTYAVGFNNLSYFSKCFKEKYKKLPSEYFK